MKKHIACGLTIIGTIVCWIGVKLALSRQAPTLLTWFVNVLPSYSLIIFGAYCLGRLGLDLISFNDYPEEIKKLEEDIIAAKLDLKARGFVQ